MPNPNTPSPDDIRKDVSDFLREKYGDQVSVPPEPNRFGKTPEDGQEEKKTPASINFDLKPTELEAHLNKYVVGQEKTIEVLATKICTHFNRMKMETSDSKINTLVGAIKSNMLMIGPTGVGKTYLVKLIADKLGVPFVKGDATKFSETGYVGGDVDDLIRNLVHEADGNINLAEYGIVYLDEIDKIASSGNGYGPDVSRGGVQRALLKLMEEGEVDLKVPHDLAAQMEAAMEAQRTGKVNRKKINTRNILFVMSGAFPNLTEIISRRMNQQPMGFSHQDADALELKPEDIFKQVKSEDLIKFGFENEFVGRIPIVVSLNHLDVDGLYHILQSPNSTVIVSKKRDFKAYGIDLEFEDAALRRMAELAHGEHTGARGLQNVADRVLLKYEKLLPDTDMDRLVLTPEIVDSPEAELDKLLTNYYIKNFQRRFLAKNNIVITFTEEAIDLLKIKAAESKIKLDEVCSNLLQDYEYGLKLLGWEEFAVDADIVRNPKGRLEELIKKSYEKHS